MSEKGSRGSVRDLQEEVESPPADFPRISKHFSTRVGQRKRLDSRDAFSEWIAAVKGRPSPSAQSETPGPSPLSPLETESLSFAGTDGERTQVYERVPEDIQQQARRALGLEKDDDDTESHTLSVDNEWINDDSTAVFDTPPELLASSKHVLASGSAPVGRRPSPKVQSTLAEAPEDQGPVREECRRISKTPAMHEPPRAEAATCPDACDEDLTQVMSAEKLTQMMQSEPPAPRDSRPSARPDYAAATSDDLSEVIDWRPASTRWFGRCLVALLVLGAIAAVVATLYPSLIPLSLRPW